MSSLEPLPVCLSAWEETSDLHSSVYCGYITRWDSTGKMSALENVWMSQSEQPDSGPSHHTYTEFTLTHGFTGIAHSWEICVAVLTEAEPVAWVVMAPYQPQLVSEAVKNVQNCNQTDFKWIKIAVKWTQTILIITLLSEPFDLLGGSHMNMHVFILTYS